MDREQAKKRMLLLYGVGDLGGDLATAFGTYYRSFYVTNIAMIPLTMQQIINPIASIWGLIAVPLYGTLLDKYRSKPGNSYGKLIKIVTPIAVLTTFLSWWVMSLNPKILAGILMVVMTIVGGFAQQLGYLGNTALMGACADNEAEKAKMSGTRGTFIKLAQTLAASVAAALLAFWTARANGNAAMPYILTATTMALLIPIGYYFNVWTTKGLEKEAAPSMNKKGLGFGESLKLIATCPPLIALLCANICSVCCSFTIAMMAAYYFNYAVQNPAMLTIYLTVSNVVGVVGSYLSRTLGAKLGLKKAAVFSMILAAAGLAIAFVFKSNVTLYTVGVSTFQFAHGAVYSLFVTMYSSCAVYSHWKSGVEKTASIMSMLSWPLTIGGFFTGLFIPSYLKAIGYDAAAAAAGTLPETVKGGLMNAVSLVPLCFYVASFLIILFAYRLDNATMEKIQRELAERKAAEEAK